MVPVAAVAAAAVAALPKLPAPPPSWPADWNLTHSTIIQPGDPETVGYFTPKHPWGIVSMDWSNARSIWMANGRNRTNCEAVSRENCRRLKQSGMAARCFIYHNMELALEWEESQKRAMYDPSKADLFLQYTDGLGHKNGTIYQENIEWGDQYFWDFTNPKAGDYFISSILESLEGPYVDGTFTDDVTGVPLEHPKVMERINMTTAQLKQLQDATTATWQRMMKELIAAGKYNWQAFGGGDNTGPGITRDTCTTFMRDRCNEDFQKVQMFMGMPKDLAEVNQTVAAFLVTRPPHGYLGFGWESDDRNWNDMFYLQAGVPKGGCTEESTGVFSRQWSNGKAVIDCRTWEASLPFPSLK